eukprot:CAMPEP_0180219146 /NCGR_PEP_ID=MMETSP0987-20121128/18239_1 /TAXON_ID=697907 /ORGANISM="non described non described, Strain CCMP2293" /LENGTH=162 /DNA_ID=CAMNT_0022179583 /DNA_START=46 /DNA_END=531 /DNA_ORIENTATION=+
MFCNSCGDENPDGAKFCSGCGKPPCNQSLLQDVEVASAAEVVPAAVFEPMAMQMQAPRQHPTMPQSVQSWTMPQPIFVMQPAPQAVTMTTTRPNTLSRNVCCFSMTPSNTCPHPNHFACLGCLVLSVAVWCLAILASGVPDPLVIMAAPLGIIVFLCICAGG